MVFIILGLYFARYQSRMSRDTMGIQDGRRWRHASNAELQNSSLFSFRLLTFANKPVLFLTLVFFHLVFKKTWKIQLCIQFKLHCWHVTLTSCHSQILKLLQPGQDSHKVNMLLLLFLFITASWAVIRFCTMSLGVAQNGLLCTSTFAKSVN